MACAIISMFLLPDFPATTTRFSEHERQLLIGRLTADSVTARTEDNPPISSLEAVQKSLGNWRTWLLTAGYMVSCLAQHHAYVHNAKNSRPSADLQHCPISTPRLWQDWDIPLTWHNIVSYSRSPSSNVI
jgi:hypothetical protein